MNPPVNVRACRDCPFLHWHDEHGDLGAYCSHPDGVTIDLDDETVDTTSPPDLCPLRSGSTLVQLDPHRTTA